MCSIIRIVFYCKGKKTMCKKTHFGLLAQLVEHSTLNRRVRGSSPRQPTTEKTALLARFFVSQKSHRLALVFFCFAQSLIKSVFIALGLCKSLICTCLLQGNSGQVRAASKGVKVFVLVVRFAPKARPGNPPQKKLRFWRVFLFHKKAIA